MKFYTVLLYFSTPSLAFLVTPNLKLKSKSSFVSSARFLLITDDYHQATHHHDYDMLNHHWDYDIRYEDEYAPPPPDCQDVSRDATSQEWIAPHRHIRNRHVPIIRHGWGSSNDAYEYERNRHLVEMELHEGDLYEGDLQEGDFYHHMDRFDVTSRNHVDAARSHGHDVTMELLLDMDLHYVVPAHVDSRILNDLTARERLMHENVFVMEGNLLRAKQIPENVYFIQLQPQDLKVYREIFL